MPQMALQTIKEWLKIKFDTSGGGKSNLQIYHRVLIMSSTYPSEVSYKIELPVKISDALLASGVMRIRVSISGCGDSGEVDEVKFFSTNGSIIDEAMIFSSIENLGSRKTRGKLISGSRILEDALYQGALTGPCSFDNDGGELQMGISHLDGFWVVSTLDYTTWEPEDDDLECDDLEGNVGEDQ